MENRKLTRNNLDRENPYTLLKEDKFEGGWNSYGRKYSERSIATLYHQNIKHLQYRVIYEPLQLEEEIKELAKRHIKKPSSLEKKSLN